MPKKAQPKSYDLVKCCLVKEKEFQYAEKLINPETIIKYAKMLGLENAPQEEFWVICLNAKLFPHCATMISRGTAMESLVDIAAIARTIILSNSVAVVLIHNHPSGEVDPSPEDRETTSRIGQALSIFPFTLVDHIIYGYKKYYSFTADKIYYEDEINGIKAENNEKIL